jgi:hypothetical protein
VLWQDSATNLVAADLLNDRVIDLAAKRHPVELGIESIQRGLTVIELGECQFAVGVEKRLLRATLGMVTFSCGTPPAAATGSFG